ncbi:hypothetical protein [Streptomyces luteireticuli]|uniref:DUF8017 domain-containing protein n=1 Tax=Streptomyces luteireticuli TaxID=173858 RepID=A0ABP3IJF8_9ACTN
MSWPQNPPQPHNNPQQPGPAGQPPQPGPPPAPQGGFGPPPTWGEGGTGHAQPTMIGGPAVPPPPPPGPVPGAGAVPPPPGPAPAGGAVPQFGQQQPQQHRPSFQPQPPAPAPRKNKTLLAVVGGVVALGVIGGGLAYALGTGGDDKKDEKAKGDDKGASAAPQTPGTPEGSSPANSPDASAYQPPKGWQTQTYERHGFSYDVPGKDAKWKLLPGDTMISYTEKGKPVVAMTGTASFHEGGCASNPNPDTFGEAGKGQLATVGTTGGGTDGTLQDNARNWAGNWGVMAYGGTGSHKPKIEVSRATPWKHNGIEGYTATAKVTVTNRPSTCVPPTAIVKSIAQKLPDGTFHGWVVYADQGVPDALPEAEIDKIMNTVRPAKTP